MHAFAVSDEIPFFMLHYSPVLFLFLSSFMTNASNIFHAPSDCDMRHGKHVSRGELSVEALKLLCWMRSFRFGRQVNVRIRFYDG